MLFKPIHILAAESLVLKYRLIGASRVIVQHPTLASTVLHDLAFKKHHAVSCSSEEGCRRWARKNCFRTTEVAVCISLSRGPWRMNQSPVGRCQSCFAQDFPSKAYCGYSKALQTVTAHRAVVVTIHPAEYAVTEHPTVSRVHFHPISRHTLTAITAITVPTAG